MLVTYSIGFLGLGLDAGCPLLGFDWFKGLAALTLIRGYGLL